VSAMRVSCARPVPSGAALKTCPPSSASMPMKAIRLPSGDQAGANAVVTPPSTRSPLPSAAATRTWSAASCAVAAAPPPSTAPALSVPASTLRIGGVSQTRRSISTTRNASSSDCWVFSRGSHAVS
jgi:hypothetical protein